MAQDCLGHPKLQATDATALLKTAFPHQNVANPSLQRSTNAGHQLLLTQRLDGTPSTTFNQGATWGGASGSFAVREGHTDCYHSGCVQCCMGSSLRAHPRLRALQLFFVWHQQARTIPPPTTPYKRSNAAGISLHVTGFKTLLSCLVQRNNGCSQVDYDLKYDGRWRCQMPITAAMNLCATTWSDQLLRSKTSASPAR